MHSFSKHALSTRNTVFALEELAVYWEDRLTDIISDE